MTPCVRPCDWIWPSGIGRVGPAQVEVVDRHRLLEHGVVRAGTDGTPASSSPGAPCSAGRRGPTSSRGRAGCASVADRSSSAAELTAPHDDDDERRLDAHASRRRARPRRPRPSCPRASVISRRAQRAGPQRHVRRASRGPDAADLGVALRVDAARKRVAGVAEHAAVRLAGIDQPERQRRRVQPLARAAARRSPPCRRRAESAGTGTARAAARSDRRRARRARGTAARRGRSTARASS